MNTKKDFEATARIIREEITRVNIELRQPAQHSAEVLLRFEGAKLALGRVASLMAENYRRENPRFDCARFLKACGMEGC